ncbi:MAG: aminopeptidase P family protein [Sandaracinus sp.]
MDLEHVPTEALRARRARVAEALAPDHAALVLAGRSRVRHYAASTFPFRAASHFLYLTGTSIEGAAILVERDRATLFRPEKDDDDELWHGASPSDAEVGAAVGCEVRPFAQLARAMEGKTIATVPCPDLEGRVEQARVLGREIRYRDVTGADRALAETLIALRLSHDDAAIREMRSAAAAADEAHRAGMRASRPGVHEREVRAAMEGAFLRRGMTTSYEPILTVHGEVLHQHGQTNVLRAGDLVLADVGAESLGGFASDVTRVWPASGAFSATQRAAYEVVLEAQRRAIASVRPGVRYRDVHLAASTAIAEGLVALGILRGEPRELVEIGAHALFFPHGVGHLIGLDVHDMEDLGDLAGYAPGRTRSAQFGLSYLRLDRDLAPGMAVTIEPGIYVVPAILRDARFATLVERHVDRAVLARFADVRGIRIEDDVLVTGDGAEVLTASIPKAAADVEAAMRG